MIDNDPVAPPISPGVVASGDVPFDGDVPLDGDAPFIDGDPVAGDDGESFAAGVASNGIDASRSVGGIRNRPRQLGHTPRRLAKSALMFKRLPQ